jgi:hypothetical protein
MGLDIKSTDDRIRQLELELIRQKTYNKIHIENYDLIKNIINNSTSHISSIFGQNLNLLKTVCNKIETIDQEGLVATELSTAIVSMHEYISILQCEDRLFQIVNGISSVADSSIQNIEDLEINNISENIINDYKKEMVPHYTIQEQRDIANNKKTINEEDQHYSAGTLELF